MAASGDSSPGRCGPALRSDAITAPVAAANAGTKWYECRPENTRFDPRERARQRTRRRRRVDPERPRHGVAGAAKRSLAIAEPSCEQRELMGDRIPKVARTGARCLTITPFRVYRCPMETR